MCNAGVNPAKGGILEVCMCTVLCVYEQVSETVLLR